ncbi:hypothetical protein M7I_1710 [Glarea lozoyensis 74030]|uniref:Uncharacterized protein n=1 Tax=Glarea lozoyensis (strain ATCC 74030 / MF5533) TaxID=1104152 RepID=H0EGU0_GLAL7|nr:hypothetical protein M7I_1710 [Glarea lozoyensis 74030]
MADSISIEEFEAALDRYEDVLEVKARSVKGETSLEELDQFRYVEAPAQFSKKTGRLMDLKDIQKLLEWKLPSLPKQVASNSDEKVHEACKDGFDHYAAHPDDIQAVIKKLTAPLKGIGPATASLLLAVHDPANVIFFSDEVYAWLVGKGKSSGISYTAKEFEQIFTASTALAKRLDVSPIDIEKVAYAIIRENEPVHTPKPKKEPSGLPRGRPKMAEHEKKPKKESSGLPRGRPKLPESQKKAKPEPKPKKEKAEPTGLPRGRPRKSDAESVVATPKRYPRLYWKGKGTPEEGCG